MTGFLPISADSHVVEPPDLRTGRVPARFRERAAILRDNARRLYFPRD